MGHHHEEPANLSPRDREYLDLMKRGDDFMHIDLFLSAKRTYKEALKVKPGNKKAQEQIYQCSANIERDTIKVLITVPLVAGAIVFLFWYFGFPG